LKHGSFNACSCCIARPNGIGGLVRPCGVKPCSLLLGTDRQLSSVTLPVALTSYFGAQSAFWGEAAALSLVATVPVVVLTLLLQRHFVNGMTLGAVK